MTEHVIFLVMAMPVWAAPVPVCWRMTREDAQAAASALEADNPGRRFIVWSVSDRENVPPRPCDACGGDESTCNCDCGEHRCGCACHVEAERWGLSLQL